MKHIRRPGPTGTCGLIGLVVIGMFASFAAPAAAAAPDRAGTPGTKATVSTPPYGPNTCKQGFVWRVARPADLVCVTPETRDLTAEENARAAERREPNGGVHGPNTCKQGFVWREAYEGDAVCVTPDRRALAKRDNALAASRRATEPEPNPKPAPTPAPRCQIVDGQSAGTPVGDNPRQFRNPGSPTLGVRWDSCARKATVHYGGMTASHYNLRINGVQRELGGSLRQYTVPEAELSHGPTNFTIQACSRSGVGPFTTNSQCTPWSPDVQLNTQMAR